MNKQRRNKLKEACSLLERVVEVLTDVKFEEQESIDNLPENLQYSDRCATMENTVDELDSACDDLQDIIVNIENLF